MAQQLLTESSKKPTRWIARHVSHPAHTQSVQSVSHAPLLQLQRTLGNQRVAQMIQAKRLSPEGKILNLQPKLTVGAADDQHEQEADRVARQVVSMSDTVAMHPMQRTMPPEEDKDQKIQTKPLAASITPVVQRQVGNDNEEDKDKPIQPKSATSLADTFEAGADVESQLSHSKGGGSPLPDPVRAYMEPRFGVDFSHVRVHTGSHAVQMNRAVAAHAFTHGADIYYGAGSSPTNLDLTAHELTHVVQQTGGTPLQTMKQMQPVAHGLEPPVQRSCAACAAGSTPCSTCADDQYEREAGRVGRQVTSTPNPAASNSVQRAISYRSIQQTCSTCGAEKKGQSASNPNISIAPFANTVTPLIQRDKIEHRALTWDDFQGKVPKKSTYEAATFSSYEDPDLKAPIPNHAGVDTGEPCKARDKNLTRFTVDITIDSAQIEVKSFMDQDKSWHKSWTTEELARRKKCEKDMSPKCEESFKGQFSKIKQSVAKEKDACRKEFDKRGSAGQQGIKVTQTVGGDSTTATTKAECQTKLAPELEKLLQGQVTWEATMSGASVTVHKPTDCRSTFLDDCAATLMEAESNDLLKHEQTHFDLTDAMAQKAQIDLRSLVDAFPKEVDACGQKAAEAKAKTILENQLNKMKANYAANKNVLKNEQAKYDKETEHGTVVEKQTAWEEKISKGF